MGLAEADVEAAGGWSVAEGYHTIQFAGVGNDYPVRNDIVKMYKAEGKQPPKDMQETVYYNRGLLTAALHVEAIRNALKATSGRPPTGEDVKKGSSPSIILRWVVLFRRSKSVPPITKVAAGCRFSRSREESSLKRRIGSARILKSWRDY